MDTIREQIIAAFTEQLGENAKRFSNRGTFVDNTTIGVVDGNQTQQSVTNDDVTWIMQISIEKYVRIEETARDSEERKGEARSKAANVALGEVLFAIGGVSITLGGLCSAWQAIDATTIDGDDTQNFTGAVVSVEIQYSHDRNNPYTLTKYA